MPHDPGIPRDKKGAPARRTRSLVVALAVVREKGRTASGPVRCALKAAGLPTSGSRVIEALVALEAAGEVALERDAAGHVRYACLPGKKREAKRPPGGPVLQLVAQVLARYEKEPWACRRSGWAAWSDVCALGPHKEKLTAEANALEAAGALQTVKCGRRARRLWARATPAHWRRFKSGLTAVRWLLGDGGRGDQEAIMNYLRPVQARPRWVEQPGPRFIPANCVLDLAPSTVREPGDVNRLRRRVRQALRMLKRAGLVEVVRHDGLVWVRATAGPPVTSSCPASGPITPTTETAQPAHGACAVEGLVMAEVRRRFGAAPLPEWML